MSTNDTNCNDTNTYTSAHERLSADEIYRLFGGSRGHRLLCFRRMGNTYLRTKSMPPNKAHYDFSAESDDWFNYLEDCCAAKAAKEVRAARRGKELADILRGMSFEEKEAYLYRTNS